MPNVVQAHECPAARPAATSDACAGHCVATEAPKQNARARSARQARRSTRLADLLVTAVAPVGQCPSTAAECLSGGALHRDAGEL